MVTTPKETRNEESPQLDLGIKVSLQSQLLIKLKRNLRTFQFSAPFLFLRKFFLWLSLGLLSVSVLSYASILNQNPESKVFVFPIFYRSLRPEISLLSFEQLYSLIVIFIGITIIFLLLAYLLVVFRRNRLSDIVLLVYIVIALMFIKNISQNLWIYNIL